MGEGDEESGYRRLDSIVPPPLWPCGDQTLEFRNIALTAEPHVLLGRTITIN